MSHANLPHHEAEASHTNDAFHGQHNPFKEYGIIFGILLVLLFATVGASYINLGEPWNFLLALAIAVTKAVLVILFFMHVKDASRVTWVFCGSSFVWLGIMLAMTLSDYITRTNVTSPVDYEMANPPARVQHEGQ